MAEQELRDHDHHIEEKPGLIYIPDMSGFTEFVAETSIEHSQYLITELLEVIIDANELGLRMVEIQGDAVLFYKLGAPPPIKAIAEQTKKMFLDFHYHLKVLERDILPGYGFKTPQSHLTLKFIAHYGDISVTKIKDIPKLMGKDVVLAHKLLKNPIKHHEYLLLTDGYMKTQHENVVEKVITWTDIKEASKSYEHIGEVNFNYIELSPLRNLVSEPPELEPVNKYPLSFKFEERINAPLKAVYKIVSNLGMKAKWVEGIKDVVYDRNKIPRVGSKYKRISEHKQAIDVQIVENKKGEGFIEYSEKLSNIPYFENALITFKLEKEDDNATSMSITFNYNDPPFFKKWFGFLEEQRMKDKWERSLKNLKNLCEENQPKLTS